MLWQRRLVHGKAMVLGGDVATLGSEVHHRLVHATIPKPTLSGGLNSCAKQKATTYPANPSYLNSTAVYDVLL